MKNFDVRAKNATATVPQGSSVADAARNWLLKLLIDRLDRGGVSRLNIKLGDGRRCSLGKLKQDLPVPTVTIVSTRAILRGWFGGLMGWAEGYVAGDWECDDIVAVTDWAMANEEPLQQAFAGGWLANGVHRTFHRLHRNTRSGSRRNIAYHYDLGNSFYRLWLDPSMTYSAAIFANSSDTLEQAQQRKYQRVMELLRPNANDQVLEIGCGWGGFGAHLLHHSRARWHGVTLSAEQLDWTLARIDKHRQRASAALCDYRDLDRRYDHIVSIEMLEAVGEANWPCYFERLRSLLKPGGRAVIQTITIADERFEAYRQSTDYIQRYIFPGGMLPCPAMIHRHIEQAGLRLLQEEAFGDHYAQTLAHWHKAFCGAWSQIEALGFDQRFKRLWQYYLAYCESGFKAGSIDVRFYQITTEH